MAVLCSLRSGCVLVDAIEMARDELVGARIEKDCFQARSNEGFRLNSPRRRMLLEAEADKLIA